MKKILVICLVTLSIIFSSSVFSAIPKGKFPIQVLYENANTSDWNNFLDYLRKSFQNSDNFRLANKDEDRVQVRLLLSEYVPRVSDWRASAEKIYTYSIVWTAKPKGKHEYLIWHNSGRFFSLEELCKIIINQTNDIVIMIKNDLPYIFN